jgi:ABC-type amino acid transport substrate-binding protein
MKKFATLLIFTFYSYFCFSQANDTLYFNYFDNAPFATLDSAKTKGLEVDIMNEYLLWLKTTKKITLTPKYISFKDFDKFYNSTKTGNKNTIGLGSVAINPERLKEVDFTSAYLKNSVNCVTNGNAPEIKTKTQNEITKTLGMMTAITVTNTTLNKYVCELKKTYLPELKILTQPNGKKVLDEIAKNVLYFGFVDEITFWYYVKNNPNRFVKVQKPLVQSKEEFGFVLPKNNSQKTLFNEFFLGFKKTKNYHLILEKHLGAYMGKALEVD